MTEQEDDNRSGLTMTEQEDDDRSGLTKEQEDDVRAGLTMTEQKDDSGSGEQSRICDAFRSVYSDFYGEVLTGGKTNTGSSARAP